jgi:ubiquinone/menaquinone biosynthesis C-methylase UbiE
MSTLAKSFDCVANKYAKFRREYPDETFATIWEIAGLEKDDAICEIGCGTGQASVRIAEKGYKLTCVEPGGNLIALAKESLKSFSNVKFINSTFENAQLPRSHFKLVVAAQSFHWVDKNSKYQKVASILKDNGVFVAFWRSNYPQSNELAIRIEEVLSTELPDFKPMTRAEYEAANFDDFKEMYESNLFVGCELRLYPYSYEEDSKSYCDGVSTWSHMAVQTSEVQKKVQSKLRAIIDRNGGTVRHAGETRFLVGRLR